jgi:transcription-repair coupling factor (superfamily II helicase)
VLAREVGVESVIQRNQRVVLTLAPDQYLTPEEVIALIRQSRRRLVPQPGKERELLFRLEGLPPDQVVAAVDKLLRQMREVISARALVSTETKEYNVLSK